MGTIESLDDPNSSQPFFTNDDGEFTLVDLDPGRYRLKIVTDPSGEIELEIPEDAARVHDFGVLTVQPDPR